MKKQSRGKEPEKIVTTLIKQATGMRIKEYCEKRLKTNPKSFYYRLRSDRLLIDEIHQIMQDTGQPFEILFPPRAPEERKARPTKEQGKPEPPEEQEYYYIE